MTTRRFNSISLILILDTHMTNLIVILKTWHKSGCWSAKTFSVANIILPKNENVANNININLFFIYYIVYNITSPIVYLVLFIFLLRAREPDAISRVSGGVWCGISRGTRIFLRTRGAVTKECAPCRAQFFLLGPRCAGRVGHPLGPLGP